MEKKDRMKEYFVVDTLYRKENDDDHYQID
jgi:hypothetical protein